MFPPLAQVVGQGTACDRVCILGLGEGVCLDGEQKVKKLHSGDIIGAQCIFAPAVPVVNDGFKGARNSTNNNRNNNTNSIVGGEGGNDHRDTGESKKPLSLSALFEPVEPVGHSSSTRSGRGDAGSGAGAGAAGSRANANEAGRNGEEGGGEDGGEDGGLAMIELVSRGEAALDSKPFASHPTATTTATATSSPSSRRPSKPSSRTPKRTRPHARPHKAHKASWLFTFQTKGFCEVYHILAIDFERIFHSHCTKAEAAVTTTVAAAAREQTRSRRSGAELSRLCNPTIMLAQSSRTMHLNKAMASSWRRGCLVRLLLNVFLTSS